MRPHFLLLLLLSLGILPLCSFAVSRRGALVGGWKPIKDPQDPHVIEIAQFAVSEYDKKSGADLRFASVIKGEIQVVSGTNYRLVVAAKDGSATKNFEAVVWEKPWESYRNLTSFKPFGG
ncbi:Cysteine proteinase inhibitor [Quillaja saponaria]|uniref:Cysteine proteinase inhibitor n=1 Tax=Quillaja saponaria TaxID=32244 RepID=A0AAD7PTX7_QUISA|nr:Cysteine proteinase inhibitor [Quillaja saponaria]